MDGILFESLAPLIKIFGPAVIDFTVAFIAVMLASTYPAIAAAYPALAPTNGHRSQRDLIRIEEHDEVEPYRDDPSAPPAPSNGDLDSTHARPSSRSISVGSAAALLFLALAILPSTIPNPTSLNQPITTHTPLALACILPPKPKSHISDLDAYLAESRRVGSSANALLWPEGAVRVDNQGEYDGMITKVGGVSKAYGVWIGVGVVGRWKGEGDDEGGSEEGQRTKKWNGVVWVGPDGKVIGDYRKSKTIPVAESFAVASHPNRAPDLVLPLPHPPHMSRSKWATEKTNYTRPIHFTSVICNGRLPPISRVFPRAGD